jgi:hypothetical protein
MLELVVVLALLGFIPAFMAHRKGRNVVLWWIYGAALFVVALPHSLLMRADTQEIEARLRQEGNRKCPFCAEFVKREAIICRHCQRELPEQPKPSGGICVVCSRPDDAHQQWCSRRYA